VTRPTADAETRPRSDEELVAAIREGHGDAWRELVLRYERLVMSVPLRLGLSREDAEEVFQATWRTLHEHLRSIRHPGRIALWVRTTARREAWRLCRERGPRASADVELDAIPVGGDDEPGDPLGELDRREVQAEVLAALDQLEPRCRDLLTRLFLDEPTPAYADLGAELGIPVGSIGPTRIRCLEKLARILGARDTG
jgi:RNA polymerase sigma factor (sigma-70 family)